MRSNSKGFAITLDSSDNIYITGTISGDIGLVKYDSAGVEQWVRTWGGSNSEVGNGVALDSSGNIYIVGSTKSYGADNYDVCLVKFDSSGVL
jgi:hypothetical protein